MAGSFIPKSSVTQKATRPRARRVSFPIFSILAYALFVAAPVASAAVFVYDQYTSKQLQQAIATLDTEIAEFSQANLQTVIEFDTRVASAKSILANHISTAAVIATLQNNLIQTVSISELAISRPSTETVTIGVTSEAASFDQLLFQRDFLQDAENISAVVVDSVAYVPPTTDGASEAAVTYKLSVDVPASAFLYTPSLVIPEPISDSVDVDEVESNDAAVVDSADIPVDAPDISS